MANKRFPFNESFFKNIDSELKAYWLGFMMADGCVQTHSTHRVIINLGSKDASHLEKWHRAIDSKNKLSFSGDGRSVASTHYSKVMCADLIAHGCLPRKSLILEFPNIQTGLINHFVRGYFDGDGCIHVIPRKKRLKNDSAVSFIGSEHFISTLKTVLAVNNKIRSTGTNKVARQLRFGGNLKVKEFYEWLYRDATVWLDRKRNIFDSHFKEYNQARHSNISGCVGVSWYPKIKKWAVKVGHKRKSHHVGYFSTVEEAKSAREEYINKKELGRHSKLPTA